MSRYAPARSGSVQGRMGRHWSVTAQEVTRMAPDYRLQIGSGVNQTGVCRDGMKTNAEAKERYARRITWRLKRDGWDVHLIVNAWPRERAAR